MTRGRDAAFTRRLAVRGIALAAVGLLVAALLGARTIQDWGVSVGALYLTGGIVLCLTVLRPVMDQSRPRDRPADHPGDATDPSAPVSALALTPLAFPTIVTPYGIAVVILMLTLRPGVTGTVEVLAVGAGVLAIDLVAMLAANRILKAPFVTTTLGIVGSVMAVLQIALGVQAIVGGIELLGFGRGGGG
jgi:multiple antibiotic resistance protein